MEKLENGRWDFATPEQFSMKVDEMKWMATEHGWNDRKVFPYSWAVRVGDFFDGYEDFEKYTPDSKRIIINEVNGLIDIFNLWLNDEGRKVK